VLLTRPASGIQLASVPENVAHLPSRSYLRSGHPRQFLNKNTSSGHDAESLLKNMTLLQLSELVSVGESWKELFTYESDINTEKQYITSKFKCELPSNMEEELREREKFLHEFRRLLYLGAMITDFAIREGYLLEHNKGGLELLEDGGVDPLVSQCCYNDECENECVKDLSCKDLEDKNKQSPMKVKVESEFIRCGNVRWKHKPRREGELYVFSEDTTDLQSNKKMNLYSLLLYAQKVKLLYAGTGPDNMVTEKEKRKTLFRALDKQFNVANFIQNFENVKTYSQEVAKEIFTKESPNKLFEKDHNKFIKSMMEKAMNTKIAGDYKGDLIFLWDAGSSKSNFEIYKAVPVEPKGAARKQGSSNSNTPVSSPDGTGFFLEMEEFGRDALDAGASFENAKDLKFTENGMFVEPGLTAFIDPEEMCPWELNEKGEYELRTPSGGKNIGGWMIKDPENPLHFTWSPVGEWKGSVATDKLAKCPLPKMNDEFKRMASFDLDLQKYFKEHLSAKNLVVEYQEQCPEVNAKVKMAACSMDVGYTRLETTVDVSRDGLQPCCGTGGYPATKADVCWVDGESADANEKRTADAGHKAFKKRVHEGCLETPKGDPDHRVPLKQFVQATQKLFLRKLAQARELLNMKDSKAYFLLRATAGMRKAAAQTCSSNHKATCVGDKTDKYWQTFANNLKKKVIDFEYQKFPDDIKKGETKPMGAMTEKTTQAFMCEENEGENGLSGKPCFIFPTKRNSTKYKGTESFTTTNVGFLRIIPGPEEAFRAWLAAWYLQRLKVASFKDLHSSEQPAYHVDNFQITLERNHIEKRNKWIKNRDIVDTLRRVCCMTPSGIKFKQDPDKKKEDPLPSCTVTDADIAMEVWQCPIARIDPDDVVLYEYDATVSNTPCVVEMGGSSVQYAFQLENQVVKRDETDEQNFYFALHKFNHHWLDFATNEYVDVQLYQRSWIYAGGEDANLIYLTYMKHQILQLAKSPTTFLKKTPRSSEWRNVCVKSK
jgi:hypothetical protein